MPPKGPHVSHLLDIRAERIWGKQETRCGKTGHPRESSKSGGMGTYLKDFESKVHRKPQDGVTYCFTCRKDYKRNPDD